jgi:hypothetical protein
MERFSMGRSRIAVCLLPALFLAVTGCASGLPGGAGRIVAEENRIPLEANGSKEGLFAAHDFLLAYGYIRDGRSLQLNGAAELRGGARNFPWLNNLFVRAFFYDADGRVLDSRSLLVRSRGEVEKRWTFAKILELPPGTEGMAFGYSGQVRGAGFDAPIWDFWNAPYR